MADPASRYAWNKPLSDAEIIAVGRGYLMSLALRKVGPGRLDYEQFHNVPPTAQELAALPREFDHYRTFERTASGVESRKHPYARSEFRLREYLRYRRHWYPKPYSAADEKPIRKARRRPGTEPEGDD